MLVGPGGIGKSSLLCGLMNKQLPEFANSTQLADLVTVKPSASEPQQLMAKANDLSMPWVVVTDDDEINEVVGVIQLVTNVSKGVTDSSRFHQFLEKTAAYAVTQLAQSRDHDAGDDYRKQISSIKNKLVREVFSRAVKQTRRNPHAQAPEFEIVINIWDCAGQSVYLDILSGFLTPKTLIMLFYDARKSLDAPVTICTNRDGKSCIERQTQNISNLEMLFQWMASVHAMLSRSDSQSASVPKYPRIITVGTHGDDPQVKAKKCQIIEELSQKCQRKAFTKLLGKGQVVDNTLAGKGDDEDPSFKELRSEVYQFISSNAIPTPVAWVLFRKIVQKVSEKQPILSYEEALEIALSCSIPPESIDSVLRFYHEVAIFLHYHWIDSLKGFVIANPQWLVKQLAKVLALEGFEQVQDPDLWNQLRENGVLMEPLYKKVWEGNGLPDEAVMDLLESCSLAAPIETMYDTQHYSGKKYFVPSALPWCSEDKLKVSTEGSVNSACTLHLLFSTRYVPPGYLTRLVTVLSKDTKCCISFSHGMYRNKFTFHFAGDEKNFINEITISQDITSIHVNVSRVNERQSCDQPFSVACNEIMTTILTHSSEIKKWFPSIKVTTAFACHKCSPDEHFIEFNPSVVTTRTRSLCQKNRSCVFNPSQQHWLQISPSDEVNACHGHCCHFGA